MACDGSPPVALPGVSTAAPGTTSTMRTSFVPGGTNAIGVQKPPTRPGATVLGAATAGTAAENASVNKITVRSFKALSLTDEIRLGNVGWNCIILSQELFDRSQCLSRAVIVLDQGEANEALTQRAEADARRYRH